MNKKALEDRLSRIEERLHHLSAYYNAHLMDFHPEGHRNSEFTTKDDNDG